MKKLFITLLFVFVFMITGCNNPDNNEKLYGITINGSQKMYVDKTYTYEAIFDPSDYSNQEVVWSASDETKVTIDSKTGEAVAINSTNEEGLFIYATSVDKPNIKGSKKVFIIGNDYYDPVYPDLNGYTITIAHADHLLSEIDPFLDGYNNSDKLAKQEAWKEVEKDFNCKIEVKQYPASAEWGPSRWNYIIYSALNNESKFDFCVVPNSKVKQFADVKAIMSLKDFYVLHGNNMMDDINIAAGKYNNELYAFTEEKSNIYNVLYYNIGLLEKLQEIDSSLEEPAQIFLDGSWTYDKFIEYCEQVQNIMEIAYGNNGKAGSSEQQYFAVSGWDAYLWIGLSTNDKEPIADVSSLQINITTPHKTQAADVVKELYSKHYADPKQNIDQNVVSWINGKSLFNTGDLWFVRDENRWSKDLWGDDTRYGYVPWPRANDIKFEDIQIALGGNDSTLVMPYGRNYEGYGDECNPENIYYALMEMYIRTNKKMSENDTLIENNVKYDANIYTDSEASQKAYIYVQELINAKKCYFDPIVVPSVAWDYYYPNQINSFNMTILKKSLNYFVSNQIDSWENAIERVIEELSIVVK